MDIVELGIKVTSDGVDKANKSLNDMPKAAGLAEKSIDSLTGTLKGLAAAYVSFEGAMSVGKTLVDFDTQVKSVAALIGKTTDEVTAMAMKSGQEFNRFAGDAASAFGVIGSKAPALLDNAAALQAVANSSFMLKDAAVATGDALNDMDAAFAVTAYLGQWGVESARASAEAERFANVAAAGAQLGSASITDMTLVMKNSGTVAASAGVSIEQFAAATQVMAERQLEGAEAGTALRNVISFLLTKGDKFEEFGIKAGSVNPKIVGLETAFRNLAPIMDNDIALTKIFGQENLVAAQILGQGADKISEMTAALTGTTTATDQALDGTKSISRQYEMLTANVKNLIVAVGGGIGFSDAVVGSLQAANSVLENIGGVINGLTIAAGVFVARGLGPMIASTAIATAKTLEHQASVAISAAGYRKVEAASAQSALIQAKSHAQVTASALAESQAHLANVKAVSLYGEARASAERRVASASAAHVASMSAVSAAEAKAAAATNATTLAFRAQSVAMYASSAAANVLKGVLAFVGGPIGAAILAGVAAWQLYKSEMVEVRIAGVALTSTLMQGFENLRYSVDYVFTYLGNSAEIFKAAIINAISKPIGDLIGNIAEWTAKIPGFGVEANALREMAAGLNQEYTANVVALDGVAAAHNDRKAAIESEMGALVDNIGESQNLIDSSGKLDTVTGELEKATGKLTTTQTKNTKSTKDAVKEAEKLRKEQEKQIGIINKLADEYERSLNPDKDWDRVDALKGLTGEYLKQGEILYDQNKAIEDQIALDAELEAYAEKESRRMDEKLAKQKQLLGLQNQASRGFEGAAMRGLTSGSISPILDFLGGDSAKDFSFENLLGGYNSDFGGFGGSVDKFIDGIGGMQNAASYISGAAQMLSGSSRGFMEGASSIIGTYLGGPLGASIGSFVGGQLSSLGIGGSGPYSGKGFAVSGSLQDFQLAALTENNKGSKRDILDTGAGTFGKWNVSDVLSGSQSLGQDQLKALLGVEETLKAFGDGLEQNIGAIGDAFGVDLVGSFRNSFDASLNIEGENFENALAVWLQETSGNAIDWARDNIDLSTLDNAGQLLFEISSAFDFNAGAMRAAKVAIDSISGNMEMLEIDSNKLGVSLVEAAGGMASLQSGLDFFYQQFTSSEEKIADATGRVNDALGDLGVELPRTRDEFNQMFKASDPETLGKLTGTLEDIDAIYDAREAAERDMAKSMTSNVQAYDTASRAHDNYIDNLMKGADSLNDWIMQQLTGTDSAATFSQQFQLAQAEFNRVASMGSQADAQDLQRSAETLLQLNRQGFGARGAGLEAQVLSQVQGIAAGMGGGSNEAVVALLQQLLDATQSGNADNTRQLRRMNDTRRRA